LFYKPLKRFAGLPREDRAALLWAAAALAAAVLRLRLLGLQRARRWAGRPPAARRATPPAAKHIAAAKRAVDRAANGLRIGTCLSRSLALQYLLRRRGIESRLRLGIRRHERPHLLAHAWLEAEGAPIGEAPGAGGAMHAFPPLPAARESRAPPLRAAAPPAAGDL